MCSGTKTRNAAPNPSKPKKFCTLPWVYLVASTGLVTALHSCRVRDRHHEFVCLTSSWYTTSMLLLIGGPKEAYDAMKPILEKVAAISDSGPCVSYLGRGGAGNYVKMVHNGIEYGDMQLIAETYDLLQSAGMRLAQATLHILLHCSLPASFAVTRRLQTYSKTSIKASSRAT